MPRPKMCAVCAVHTVDADRECECANHLYNLLCAESAPLCPRCWRTYLNWIDNVELKPVKPGEEVRIQRTIGCARTGLAAILPFIGWAAGRARLLERRRHREERKRIRKAATKMGKTIDTFEDRLKAVGRSGRDPSCVAGHVPDCDCP